MTFAQPLLLVGLALVPLAIVGYLLVQRRRHRYAVRFTNIDLLANLAPRSAGRRRHIPPLFYLAAISFLAFGLARPSLTVAVPREEATVILTMDVSGSMTATDVAPTRLAAAKKAASDFVDQLPAKFKIGVVAFSTSARVVTTPTTDRVAVHAAIDGLQAKGGTALGDAIVLSLESAGLGSTLSGAGSVGALPAPRATDPPAAGSGPDSAIAPGDQPLVATVLLSDGKNSTGDVEPDAAAKQAAAAGVPVYTIALGTPNGEVTVPDQNGQMHTLQVPPDSATLTSIAETTGGRFFEAPTSDDLAQIYQNLGSKVGYTNQEQEVTQWFAAAGLLFVLVGAGLAALWFNRFP